MIEVRELTKVFDTCKAVDGVSFQVKKGEILGFLGPNGAGKSTTMRMITGYLPPTSGTALIGGCDILSNGLAARRKIGYLPENAPVYRDMSVRAFLDFVAEIRGFAGADRRRVVERTLERCFLKEVRNQSVMTLSKGFKQRVCFAQSILHDPEYLIFDEPTDGLDPNQKHEVRQMIRAMSPDKAIILSTHILDEMEAVCTRAIIIAGGRIAADDTPDGLRSRSASHGAVSVEVSGGGPDTVAELERIPEVRAVESSTRESGMHLRVFPKTPGGAVVDGVLAVLTRKGASVRSLFVEQGRLDEVFRSITVPETTEAERK